ncbi:hypothetical protein HPB51_017882 [Rhipicephalus microplus]|uniref:Uncharacterized protein n=1 Tax=Rhipicephalus microplus TaxID=6941 RepID=A0A9J6DB91_RHIMP|nr:hypothetical protein HPB51_017882 [Rhipicephalus microplus]
MDCRRTCQTCGRVEAFEHVRVRRAAVDGPDRPTGKAGKRLLALALTVRRRRQDTEESGELRSPHGCCQLRTGPHEHLRSFLLPSYTRPLPPLQGTPLPPMLRARTRTVVPSTNISVSRLVFGNILRCTSTRAAMIVGHRKVIPSPTPERTEADVYNIKNN